MHESFWGTFIISVGLIIIALLFFMQKFTNTSEANYTLLKETTEAAMRDSFDLDAYINSDNNNKIIRINREAFIESFVRRFSQNASLSNTYVIEIYDVNEYPPKVSLRLKTKEGGVVLDKDYEFDVVNQIDAILETTY